MLQEISALSPEVGIGFFFLYEDPKTRQKSLQYLKKLKQDDLKTITKSLEKSQQSFVNGHLSVKEISKFSQNKADVIIALNNCLSQLNTELSTRKRIKSRQQIERYNKKQARKKFIFDAVRIMIIGLMAILFTLSLFSDNTWIEQDSVVYFNFQTQNGAENSEFSYQNYHKEQERKQTLHQQQIQDIIQMDKQYTENIQPQKISIESYEQNLNTSIPLGNQTLSQNVTFSSFDIVQKPLVFSYEILLNFTTHETAHFICEKILFYLFWAFAVFLFILQIFAR